jgi:(2R)-3-sulfolactate dehydrogenase (NADP+)
MEETVRVKHERLVALICNALAQVGVPTPVRETEAEIMAEADLLGVPSHGVRMLPVLVKGIRDGRAQANPRLTILRDRGAICVLDGDNGPGRFVSSQAMHNAVERAKQFGIGVCLTERVTHWGRAHAYAYRATLAGMIGICTTNAIPNMLAWGSSSPLLGNNPLAIGVPRGQNQDPIILDMAMSQAAVGKIGTYLREGRPVPMNWGLDKSGCPTDDPAEIMSSQRILPFGDHKGAGLALMMEILTGALAGGLLSHEIIQADPTGLDTGSSKIFLALDPHAFGDPNRFAKRVEDFIEYLQSAEPELTITLPGERGWETRDRYLKEGIPIHSEIVAQLKAIGVDL